MSENFHKAKKDFNNQGIEVEGVKLNIKKMMSNKNKSVQVLTKGVEFLFKKNKVTYIKGKGVLFSKNDIVVYDNDEKSNYSAKNIVIATGSSVASLPGIEIDEKNVISSTGALSLNSVPKKLAVIGGGYIGLEMGSVWSRLGSKVTVFEYLEYITPGMDREISNEFKKILTKQGINFKMGSKVSSVKNMGDIVSINYTDIKNSKAETLVVDKVLVSVGRKPYTEGLNLSKIGVKKDGKGRIEVDGEGVETSIGEFFDSDDYHALNEAKLEKLEKLDWFIIWSRTEAGEFKTEGGPHDGNFLSEELSMENCLLTYRDLPLIIPSNGTDIFSNELEIHFIDETRASLSIGDA